MVDLAVKIEAIEPEALEEWNERRSSGIPGQQAVQFIDAYNHHGFPAAESDALRSLALGTPDHFAEPGFGILEFPGAARTGIIAFTLAKAVPISKSPD